MIEEINIDNLEELEIKHPMIPLTFDRMLKALFENNQDIYKMFISSVVHLDLNDIDMEIKNTELPTSNGYEYKKIIDFNVDINKNILLNIELNRTYFNSVKQRNRIYHAKKISMNLKKGDNKDKLKDITNIQLNLNVKDKSNNLGEDIVVPYSIITNTIYVNNDITYIRYLDYYRNLYYNNKDIELEESDYWLVMLTANSYVELNEILSKFLSDELRIRIVKDVIKLSSDEMIFDEYEQMIGEKMVDYEDELRAKEEGRIAGKLEGKLEEKIEIIRSMLENNFDYETISKICGKTIEEIEKIKETM